MILVNLFERPASRLLFCGNSVGALFPVILGAWSQDSNIFETSLHLLIEIILSLKPLNIIPNTQLFHIFFHNKMPYTKCHATVGISANQRHDKLHLMLFPVTNWAWCVFLSLTPSEKNIFCELSNLDLRNHVDIWTFNSYLMISHGDIGCKNGKSSTCSCLQPYGTSVIT